MSETKATKYFFVCNGKAYEFIRLGSQDWMLEDKFMHWPAGATVNLVKASTAEAALTAPVIETFTTSDVLIGPPPLDATIRTFTLSA